MLRLALVLALLPFSAAAGCRDMMFDAVSYTVCEVRAGQDLRLFEAGHDGVYGSFNAVEAELAARGETLGFAMNAGMYHPDRSPVGLYVEDYQQKKPLVTRAGPGNFGLLPNGVFCFGDGVLRVVESLRFKAEAPRCRYATQSGPMLVIDGRLHPAFRAGSESRQIRNGVGTSADGQRAFFAISNQAVNFHDFARLFRDSFGVNNALYFDGKISRLLAPELARMDAGFPMGPMLGLVVPRG